jgi:hypothetical protein
LKIYNELLIFRSSFNIDHKMAPLNNCSFIFLKVKCRYLWLSRKIFIHFLYVITLWWYSNFWYNSLKFVGPLLIMFQAKVPLSILFIALKILTRIKWAIYQWRAFVYLQSYEVTIQSPFNLMSLLALSHVAVQSVYCITTSLFIYFKGGLENIQLSITLESPL